MRTDVPPLFRPERVPPLVPHLTLASGLPERFREPQTVVDSLRARGPVEVRVLAVEVG